MAVTIRWPALAKKAYRSEYYEMPEEGWYSHKTGHAIELRMTEGLATRRA
jgi:hypothetical protein